MGPVSIGVEVQRNTDGDTPSTGDAAQPQKSMQMIVILDMENEHQPARLWSF